MKPIAFDMEGLVKAFTDADRVEREYILDTDTGRVHFVPVEYLRQAEEGSLRPGNLQGQARERAEVAAQYLDDIGGRFEIVPFLDPEAEGDWKQEFLAEKGASDLTPELQFNWSVYRAERIQDEIGDWLEETGIGQEDEADDETWDDGDDEVED